MRKHKHAWFQVAPVELIVCKKCGKLVLNEIKQEPPKRPSFSLADKEAKAIVEALNAYGGNRTKVAQALGISRCTLWRKLKEINEPRRTE